MITKMKIHGYRIYKKFELAPNKRLNLIVGANEAGKSTLIEALTLALTGWIYQESRSIRRERVFPDLPNATGLGFGRQLSRQFFAYIKERGVSDSGLGFYAFRHTFATLLDKAGESVTAISRLTGHWEGQPAPSTLDKFYIHRENIPLRMATVAKFAPGVTLPISQKDHFKKELTGLRSVRQ
ncbi:AAA family ATPase [Lysobacter yananisis]|uniref:AAA family ATPase n=1 Tax=Lysobacter yananisis TaxID=1003114 RepID=UPI003CE586A5